MSNLLAQEGIQTAYSQSVENLVKNIFIKGNCKNVSNINSIGNEALSIGQFNNGSNNINLNDGIILSTGDISLAQGPNINIDASFSFDNESDDPDLSQLATDDLFDATGIEFDFIPLDNTVSFRYVFASEEYCEFVGTSFNDVFGFFVSGPGINGNFDNNAINVATVTSLNGTDIDVSINNINHIENETFYVSNITTTDAQNCNIGFNAQFQELIEYDGFTIPLTASFQVIPCETYHIRLVIGDVGDGNLDSAVFLETNSFDLGEAINVRAEVLNSEDPIAYESCTDGAFIFTRNSLSNINEDLIVNYNISPESIATNGVDFSEIPLSITIPAGSETFTLPIEIIADNISEGPENLKLELQYDCDCIDPTISELIINEAADLTATFNEIAVCAGEPFKISLEIDGGVSPLNYLWDNGIDSANYHGTLFEPAQVAVTITDFCGQSISTLADIKIQDIPSATLSGTYNLCETTNVGIPIQLEGNPPWEIGYSIDGDEQNFFNNIQSSPFFLETPSEGTYELTFFNDAYCEGNIIGSAEVESPFNISTNITSPSCPNSSDGKINITQLEAVMPFSIHWNIETENDFMLSNLGADTYLLTVVDGDGCLYEEAFDLTEISSDIKDCIPIYIPNGFSPNNDGLNDLLSIFSHSSNEQVTIISFQIYNRWGALIYEQENFIPDNGRTGWDGQFEGQPLNSGVFTYKIEIAFENGTTNILNGDITLMR